MKKNIKKNIKSSLNNLKDVLNSLLSSKKLMAAVLAPLALTLVACPSGNDDDNTEIPAGPVTVVSEEEIGRELSNITGVNSKVSAKTTDEAKANVLFNTEYTVHYKTTYSDKTEKTSTKVVSGKDLKFAELDKNIQDKISFSFDDDTFPESKKDINLTVTYNGNTWTVYVANDNYKGNTQGSQGGENLKDENIKEVVKTTLGEDYDKISEEISKNKSITLTAQTIDAVIDIFSDSKSVKEKVENLSDDEKIALVAQAEDKISLEKEVKTYIGISGSSGKTLPSIVGSEYKISAKDGVDVSLNGNFGYFSNHIELLSDNINISDVTISSEQKVGNQQFDAILLIPAEELTKEIYNKLNLDKENPSLPTLNFELAKDYVTIKDTGAGLEFGLRHFLDIYSKYNKAGKVDEKLPKLNKEIPFTEIDGRALVEDKYRDSYSLFKGDGNDVKTSKDDNDIKDFNVKELAAFTNRYKIKDVRNLIISGTLDSDKTTEVDWMLTNIIFENDMTNLKNKSTSRLKGIVYFRSFPYNNEGAGDLSAYGIVKLDRLSYTFSRISSDNILDVRGVPESDINKYDASKDLVAGGANYIYFSKDFEKLAKKGGGNNADFYEKFINTGVGGIESEYFGDDGVRQDSFGAERKGISSRTPRKLKEFEFYGNNDYYKIPAINDYSDEEFYKLSPAQQSRLDDDANKAKYNNNTLAKVDFVDPDTQKIILSVLKDRQYNV